jgi:hypothetical protein
LARLTSAFFGFRRLSSAFFGSLRHGTVETRFLHGVTRHNIIILLSLLILTNCSGFPVVFKFKVCVKLHIYRAYINHYKIRKYCYIIRISYHATHIIITMSGLHNRNRFWCLFTHMHIYHIPINYSLLGCVNPHCLCYCVDHFHRMSFWPTAATKGVLLLFRASAHQKGLWCM